MTSASATYTRLKNRGNVWGVRIPTDLDATTGDTVTVHTRGGKKKEEKLGTAAKAFGDATLYEIAVREASADKPKARGGGIDPLLEPGKMYETDEGIFVIAKGKDSGRPYAKKMVELREAQGDRMNEPGDAVRIKFEYARGAIYRISADDKMDLERAKELSIRYGRCVRCGIKLEVKESVEAGMGPVCRKAFS